MSRKKFAVYVPQPEICRWELTFSFSREQVRSFLEEIYKLEDYQFPNFSVTREYSDKKHCDIYIVSLTDGIWAHNLVAVAAILEKCDHESI